MKTFELPDGLGLDIDYSAFELCGNPTLGVTIDDKKQEWRARGRASMP